jgi:hypothetical protein
MGSELQSNLSCLFIPTDLIRSDTASSEIVMLEPEIIKDIIATQL